MTTYKSKSGTVTVMTKEEILAKKFNTPVELLDTSAHCRVSSALSAMQEYATQEKLGWVNARNEAPTLTEDYQTIEILADTGDYNNYEVVIFDGTDYFDKHRNDDDGNPVEITDEIVRWRYIELPQKPEV